MSPVKTVWLYNFVYSTRKKNKKSLYLTKSEKKIVCLLFKFEVRLDEIDTGCDASDLFHILIEQAQRDT